jgi:hypothetical protein
MENPVQVLENQYERLHLAFPEQNALEGVERALAALGRLESQERAVRREGLQQEQDRGDGFVERFVERDDLPGNLGPDRSRVVAVFDVDVVLEQFHHRIVGRGFAIYDTEALSRISHP